MSTTPVQTNVAHLRTLSYGVVLSVEVLDVHRRTKLKPFAVLAKGMFFLLKHSCRSQPLCLQYLVRSGTTEPCDYVGKHTLWDIPLPKFYAVL